MQVGQGGLACKHDSGMNEALALEFRQGRLATQHMSVLADGEVRPLARGLIFTATFGV